MSSPCRWMLKPSCLRRSATPTLDGERERFRQIATTAGPRSRRRRWLRAMPPAARVADRGYWPSSSGPGGSGPSSSWTEAPPNPPAYVMSFLHRFLARGPVAPGRQHPALHLGCRKIVLESQQATDDLGGVPEERVRQGRHAPMQPDALLAGDSRQHRHGPVPQSDTFGRDATPDSQDDPSGLGPGFLAGQFVLQLLIQERAQFRLRRSFSRADPARRRATPA